MKRLVGVMQPLRVCAGQQTTPAANTVALAPRAESLHEVGS